MPPRSGRSSLLAAAVLATALATPACGEEAKGLAAVQAGALAADERQPVLLAALESLLAAEARNPDAADIQQRLGETYALLGRREEALPHYERAAAARPGDRDLALALISLHVHLGHPDAVADLLPALLADEHIDGDSLYQLALLLDYEGLRDLALAAVERASRLDPASAANCLALEGRFRFEAADFVGAHERFAAALAGRPDALEALKGLADSSRRLGRQDEALHWDEVLRLMLALHDDEYIKKRTEQRRAALERLTAIHPRWTTGWRQLAGLLERAGEGEAACELIGRLVDQHGAALPPGEADSLRMLFCP